MAPRKKPWPPEYGVPDEDSPELTEEFFRNARPAEEVIPGIVAAAERLRIRLGRPKLDNPKEHVTLRLDPVVVASFKEDGPGWQGRINEALVELVKRRRKPAARRTKRA